MNYSSANEVAQALGLKEQPHPACSDHEDSEFNEYECTFTKPCYGYEWLHLSAHRFGSILPDKSLMQYPVPSNGHYKGNPQQFRNLVLGTKAANTPMLIFEEAIKEVVDKFNIKVKLCVVPHCMILPDGNYTSWLASEIEYKFFLQNKTELLKIGSFKFNPFERITPSNIEYTLYVELFTKKVQELIAEIQNPVKSDTFNNRMNKKNNLVSYSLNENKHSLNEYELLFPISQIQQPAYIRELYSSSINSSFLLKYQDPQCGHEQYQYYANAIIPGELSDYGKSNRQFINENMNSESIFDYPQNNFTFGELFENFDCEFLDQFVFDNVSITKEEEQGVNGIDNIIVFSGELRMDKGGLASFGSLLNVTSGLRMSVRINIGTQELSGKVKPKSIILRSEAEFQLPLVQDVILKKGVLQLSFIKKIDYIERETRWTIIPYLNGIIQFNNLSTTEPVDLNCIITWDNGKLHASASCDSAKGLFGYTNLA
jgi:hypothetical protein